MEGDKDDEYSRVALSALAGKSQEGLEHIALEAHNGVGFARIRGFDGNYYRVPISNEEFLSLAKMREKARLDRERYAYREKRKQLIKEGKRFGLGELLSQAPMATIKELVA